LHDEDTAYFQVICGQDISISDGEDGRAGKVKGVVISLQIANIGVAVSHQPVSFLI
jgi:hypothetical protein